MAKRILSGLRHPVVIVLLTGLMVPDLWGATATPHEAGNDAVVLQLHGSEFKFIPSVLKVAKGQKVTIIFTNDGVLAHNFAIDSLVGLRTKTIQSHGTAKLTFTPEKTGSFKFRCLVPGHMQAGMKGELVVSANSNSSGG